MELANVGYLTIYSCKIYTLCIDIESLELQF